MKNQTSGSVTWAHFGDLHITTEYEASTLHAVYRGLDAATLPYSITVGSHRCIFLDVVSAGAGGPDFALGNEQLSWLEAELQSAKTNEQGSVVFMHVYPADFNSERQALLQLFQQHRVAFVDMGHTHYNELVNDGETIFATTRSTGQIEEGPVGFSIASISQGVVSWRFKPLRTLWPFVMITSPADHRLITNIERPSQVAVRDFRVEARVFEKNSRQWYAECESPSRHFELTVEATDSLGTSDTDTIVVAGPGYRPPQRQADGSDLDSVGAWPERHILATRLVPNRNGRQW